MATENKDFRVKNGLVVQGTTATVNGNSVLTSASNVSDLADVSTSTPANGDVLAYSSGTWTPTTLEGYRYVITLYITSSGTFSKGDYPWLRAMRVVCIGGGGGGGASAITSFVQNANGVGGSGAGRAESLITDIAGLDSSVTLTVGAGGTGGTSSTNATDGGETSFGTIVIGAGGNRGLNATAVSVPNIIAGQGGKLASNSTGDLVYRGVSSSDIYQISSTVNITCSGGWAVGYPPSVSGKRTTTQSAGSNAPAADRGRGGQGAAAVQSRAQVSDGGNGTGGIIILELYA